MKIKFGGQFCDIFIDGRSINNLVSTYIVEKLSLLIFPHVKPYKVSWLNKVYQVLVNQCCEVSFERGGYKDQVLCNVIPMNAYHLLLGRPW